MTKIYTKTGDNGTTGIFGSNGIRLKKYDIRIETYGTVDELNSFVGLIHSTLRDIDDNEDTYGLKNDIFEKLFKIQKLLFNISSQLSLDHSDVSNKIKNDLLISDNDIEFIESSIDSMDYYLTELNDFILPSGHIASVYAHVARTVCRRCERRIVELSEQINIDRNLIIFINRLSDYLFVLARFINHITNNTEYKWKDDLI